MPQSRQPLVKGERLVRCEVSTAIIPYGKPAAIKETKLKKIVYEAKIMLPQRVGHILRKWKTGTTAPKA